MKDEYTFEQWFIHLQEMVFDRTGVQFRDKDSVIEDYEDGKHFDDVAEEIALEYE